MSRDSRSPVRGTGLALALLVAGAVALGTLAWHEAERARRTADLLMRDYASFTADKFVRESADRFRRESGMTADRDPRSPFAEMEGAGLPSPHRPDILYYFSYEPASRRLQFSGRGPDPEERNSLLALLSRFDPACRPNGLFHFSRLGGVSAEIGEDDVRWSGLVLTDAAAAPRLIRGFRLDYPRAVATLLVPLIVPGECDCPPKLLPRSLASLGDARAAAAFVIRDGRGRERYRSGPSPASAAIVSQKLADELPFADWSIEVALHPESVRPLLPYGGRGAPWPLLGMAGALVVGAAGVAYRSLRRERELARLRQDFVAGVSHELKTPLARIRLFNELLMDERLAEPEKRARYRESIDRESRRLTLLLETVLDFSRQERGRAVVEREPLDLQATFEEALAAFRAVSDSGRLLLITHLEKLPSFLGDGRALQRVLINLLDNAAKYSPPGAPIEVRLDAPNGVARLAVTDRGFGIEPADLPHIFDDFYRGRSKASGASSGSGLGLALVRRTVEAHGGKVWAESSGPRGGSRFVVELPLPTAGRSPS